MNRVLLSSLAVIALSPVARGGAADYVFTPIVEFGEREIDFKFGSSSFGGAGSSQAGSLGLGFGVKPWWFTEGYAKFKHEDGRTFLDAFEWENKFQLVESGKYPVDLGWLLEIERPQDRSEGYELKTGALLQSDVGRVQLNANILIERVFDSAGSNGTELGYQLQAKYRWRPAFEFGAQALGEVGDWTRWAPSSEQNHRWGPAVFGKVSLGGRKAIRYNAGLLLGLARASPDTTFRAQLEYEF
jgi:hypothetical protein